MSKKEKLIERFNSSPRDFTFEELITLMSYLGYRLDNGGKTSGSRVRFIKEGCPSVTIHKTHSYKCLLPATISHLKKSLKEK